MRPVLLLCAVIVACSEASTVWKQHWDKDPDLWRRDNSGEKTATQQTLPNTLLFVAEEYAQELGFTRERTEVTIHVLGGSFPTEGRADWRYLKSQLISSVLPNLKVPRRRSWAHAGATIAQTA